MFLVILKRVSIGEFPPATRDLADEGVCFTDVILQLLEAGGHDHLVAVFAGRLEGDGNHYLVERLHSRRAGSLRGFWRRRVLPGSLGQNCPHLLTGRVRLVQLLIVRPLLSGVVRAALPSGSSHLPGVLSLHISRLPGYEVLGLYLHHHLVYRYVVVEQRNLRAR